MKALFDDGDFSRLGEGDGEAGWQEDTLLEESLVTGAGAPLQEAQTQGISYFYGFCQDTCGKEELLDCSFCLFCFWAGIAGTYMGPPSQMYECVNLWGCLC